MSEQLVPNTGDHAEAYTEQAEKLLYEKHKVAEHSVSMPNETELAKPQDEQSEVVTAPLAIHEAEALGLTEDNLRHFGAILAAKNSPREQRMVLQRIITRDGLETNDESLLQVTRKYHVERIRSTEHGPLLHYHQTKLDNFAAILDEGGLISHDERKRRGADLRSSGARPDVVQMTRDYYDTKGRLVKPGLAETSSQLIAESDLAFVFDGSIMDAPNYDSINAYPNLPGVPLDKAVAIVVNQAKNMDTVRDQLVQSGRGDIRVVLRADWLRSYNDAQEARSISPDRALFLAHAALPSSVELAGQKHLSREEQVAANRDEAIQKIYDSPDQLLADVATVRHSFFTNRLQKMRARYTADPSAANGANVRVFTKEAQGFNELLAFAEQWELEKAGDPAVPNFATYMASKLVNAKTTLERALDAAGGSINGPTPEAKNYDRTENAYKAGWSKNNYSLHGHVYARENKAAISTINAAQ